MLTNDSKKVLYILYSEYKARRSAGSSKSDAVCFLSAESIRDDFFPDLLLEDVEDALRELGSEGYLNNLYADDTIALCFLTNDAITSIEQLPIDTLKSLLSFVSNFLH